MSTIDAMEEYYQKVIQLQEKLRRSEEERLKLEMRYNDTIQQMKEKEEAHCKKLGVKYKQFLEEDRRRQQRNDKILDALDKIENRTLMWKAKIEKFKAHQKHFHNYFSTNCRFPERDIVDISSANYRDYETLTKSESNYSNLGNINSTHWKREDRPLKDYEITKTSKDLQNSLRQNVKTFNDLDVPITPPKQKFEQTFSQQTSQQVHDELKRILKQDNLLQKPEEYEKQSYTSLYKLPRSITELQNENEKTNDELENVPISISSESKVQDLQQQKSKKEAVNPEITVTPKINDDGIVKVKTIELDDSKSNLETEQQNHSEFKEQEKQNFNLLPKLKPEFYSDVQQSEAAMNLTLKELEQKSNGKESIKVNEINSVPRDTIENKDALNEKAEAVPFTSIITKDIEQDIKDVNVHLKIEQPLQINEEEPIQGNEKLHRLSFEGEKVQTENIADTQHYYDDRDQLQYNEDGQPIQYYSQNPLDPQYYNETNPYQQCNENGQLIQQYDENCHDMQQYYVNNMMQYDENGQMLLQYDEHGQPLLQYDENGQPVLRYGENEQLPGYPNNEETNYVPYVENNSYEQNRENPQPNFGENLEKSQPNFEENLEKSQPNFEENLKKSHPNFEENQTTEQLHTVVGQRNNENIQETIEMGDFKGTDLESGILNQN
ncbi:hypothetical protein FQA39_LY06931 [Lamprigera yunnana]|nr:hypothetical protein FQA39_LY06931 [Lamprigera yunnana]